MLISALKAMLGIVVILGGWLLVQAAWRRVFSCPFADEDALAGRLGCHGCPCESPRDELIPPTAESKPPVTNQSTH